MKKIKPINSKTLKASKKTYDDLFEDLDFYIKTKLKARGIHDLIFNVYKKKIKNSEFCQLLNETICKVVLAKRRKIGAKK